MPKRSFLGGGIEGFSTFKELFWYFSKCSKSILRPRNLSNLIIQNIEFRERKTRLSSYPYVIQIEGTNLCNLNCPMCHRKLQGREFGQMSLESAIRYTKGMPNLSWISLGGWGEPFMCRDLFRIIDYLNSQNIGVGLITNGTLLTNDNVNKICSSRTFRMGISIDTTIPDKIRDYKDFGAVRDGIVRLITHLQNERKYVPLRIVSTVMKENIGDLEGILRFAKEVGISHVHLHGVGSFDDRTADTGYVLPDKVFLHNSAMSLEETARGMGIKLTNNAIHDVGPKTICRIPWTTTFVSWQGNVHPCCLYLEKSFGNLNEQDFKTIWNNEAYCEFRKNLATKNFDKICVERCGLKA